MVVVEIAPPAYDVVLDLVYATPGNFTGRPVYRRSACYLHADAAARLEEAIRLAAAIGYRLKIFDGFRPAEAQWALWCHTPNPDFLTHPGRGSPHSRGVAVDLTLVERDGGAPDMGTPFDSFSPRSHHGSTAVSRAAQRNRALLLGLMTAAGWDFYRNEWWHYQLFDARRYPVLSDSAAGTGLVVPKPRTERCRGARFGPKVSVQTTRKTY